MRGSNCKKSRSEILVAEASGFLLGLFAMVCLVFTSILCYADNGTAISLNDAVDDGRVRIIDSKSRGGYSRFTMELENTGNKPVSVDPYGSAFDPPGGVRTQRVGIGLPLKIGDRRIDMRKKLSTDPSQEAPVGEAANQNSSGKIPDGALPVAAGAAAAAAAVGTALTGMAQGVRPKEAISDLMGLVQGEGESVPDSIQTPSDFDYQTGIIQSYRDQDMTELDYQKQRLQAAKEQGAEDVVRDAEAAVRRLKNQIDNYDKNLADLGLKPLEHTEMEKRSFDYTRKDIGEEVKAELAAEAVGTISDTDRIRMDLWMIDNAPTEQSYNDMKDLVDKMTVKSDDGTVIGDKESILKSLGNELQRTNQPRYTYFENYALREEIMENAKGEDGLVEKIEGYKEEYDDLKDAVDTITGKAPEEHFEEQHKEKMEGWENDGKSPGSKAIDGANKIKEVYDAGKTILDDAAGYQAAGNSRTLALTKATTQYLVDTGLNTILDKNPVMKTVNTVLNYVSPEGKELTAGKGLRILVDKAFDSATGELDHKAIEKLDFNSAEVKDAIRESQIKALEKRTGSPGLSESDRQDITNLITKLRKT